MPRSYSSPAARTSGASGPCGSTVRRAESARVGAELRAGDRHQDEEDADQDPGRARARGPSVMRRSPRARAVALRRRRLGVLPGQPAGRDREHEPGDRVLEKAAVEERVHEQREEGCAEREPQRLLAPADGGDQPHAADEQPGVERQADQPQLGGHGQRGRVRDEVGRRAVAVLQPPARSCLAADSDAEQRVLLDHAQRVLHALGAVARDPVQDPARRSACSGEVPPATSAATSASTPDGPAHAPVAGRRSRARA